MMVQGQPRLVVPQEFVGVVLGRVRGQLQRAQGLRRRRLQAFTLVQAQDVRDLEPWSLAGHLHAVQETVKDKSGSVM